MLIVCKYTHEVWTVIPKFIIYYSVFFLNHILFLGLFKGIIKFNLTQKLHDSIRLIPSILFFTEHSYFLCHFWILLKYMQKLCKNKFANNVLIRCEKGRYAKLIV